MAMERGMIIVCVLATLLSMVSAIPGTATYYTVYVRKYINSLDLSL